MENLNSVWQNSEEIKYNTLEKDLDCEILIVGGGIAGILTAYTLSERGHDVALVEAGRIMNGVISNSTATITSQHGLIYTDIAKKYGEKNARIFYDSQELAIDMYEGIISKHGIDCDFKRLNGYLYTRDNDTRALKREFELLNKIGAEVRYIEKIDNFPLEITAAIAQKKQGQFNPIKFLNGLPVNYTIYENSRVIAWDLSKNIVKTDKAQITAQKIIIATNYPIVNLPAMFFTKEYQSISYAMAFKNAADLNGIFNDDKDDGFTFRNYNDMLIVNGLDHRTGRKKSNNSFERLNAMAHALYPQCEKTCSWLGEDCVTYDDIPLVGKFKKNSNNNFVITGFNKWGIANAAISANIIADIIDETPNKFANLFSPQRKYITHNLGSFIQGAALSAINLCKSFLTVPLKPLAYLEKGKGEIFIINGKKCAAYKDMDGKLFIIPARCAHLGCELTFNLEALTWDCPCHGSRYDIYGNIVAEPTVKALH